MIDSPGAGRARRMPLRRIATLGSLPQAVKTKTERSLTILCLTSSVVRHDRADVSADPARRGEVEAHARRQRSSQLRLCRGLDRDVQSQPFKLPHEASGLLFGGSAAV